MSVLYGTAFKLCTGIYLLKEQLYNFNGTTVAPD